MLMLLNGEPLETYRKQIRAFLLSNFTSLKRARTSTRRCSIKASSTRRGARGDRIHRGDFDITVEDSELLPENLDSIEGIAQYVIRKSNPVPLRVP
jgi:hypothetical protein